MGDFSSTKIDKKENLESSAKFAILKEERSFDENKNAEKVNFNALFQNQEKYQV